MHNKTAHTVAFLLLVLGGINWLLVGALNFDLVRWLCVDILGTLVLAQAVYIIVGLSAIYVLFTHKTDCRQCSHESAGEVSGAEHSP